MKTHRLVFLSLTLGLGGAGAFGLACSTSNNQFNPDSGVDSGVGDSGKDGTPTDGSKRVKPSESFMQVVPEISKMIAADRKSQCMGGESSESREVSRK